MKTKYSLQLCWDLSPDIIKINLPPSFSYSWKAYFLIDKNTVRLHLSAASHEASAEYYKVRSKSGVESAPLTNKPSPYGVYYKRYYSVQKDRVPTWSMQHNPTQPKSPIPWPIALPIPTVPSPHENDSEGLSFSLRKTIIIPDAKLKKKFLFLFPVPERNE